MTGAAGVDGEGWRRARSSCTAGSAVSARGSLDNAEILPLNSIVFGGKEVGGSIWLCKKVRYAISEVFLLARPE